MRNKIAGAVILSSGILAGCGAHVKDFTIGTTGYRSEGEKTERRREDTMENVASIVNAPMQDTLKLHKQITNGRPEETTPMSPYERLMMLRSRISAAQPATVESDTLPRSEVPGGS